MLTFSLSCNFGVGFGEFDEAVRASRTGTGDLQHHSPCPARDMTRIVRFKSVSVSRIFFTFLIEFECVLLQLVLTA